MPRFDAKTADCRIFTFKEGLLSAVAHDLELVVRSFEIELAEDRSRITGRFDARSIEVVDAIVDGRRSPGTLSDKDKAKIQSNIVSDVIGAKQFPEVRFASTAIDETPDGWNVRGTIELAGKNRQITVRAKKDAGAAVGSVVLHQPDFGIKPYTAMLGTLKVKADVEVRVRVPLA